MFSSLPRSQPIGLVQYQHRILYERQNAVAELGMPIYGFHVILKDTFAPGDLDTVINKLLFRGQGDLEQFVEDRDLFVRVVGEIMTEFNMQQLPSVQASTKQRLLGLEDADGRERGWETPGQASAPPSLEAPECQKWSGGICLSTNHKFHSVSYSIARLEWNASLHHPQNSIRPAKFGCKGIYAKLIMNPIGTGFIHAQAHVFWPVLSKRDWKYCACA